MISVFGNDAGLSLSLDNEVTFVGIREHFV